MVDARLRTNTRRRRVAPGFREGRNARTKGRLLASASSQLCIDLRGDARGGDGTDGTTGYIHLHQFTVYLSDSDRVLSDPDPTRLDSTRRDASDSSASSFPPTHRTNWST